MAYSYRGKSVGRLIAFIEKICGYHISSQCIFGNEEVKLHGKRFATYKWCKDRHYHFPYFTFRGERPNWYQRYQEDIFDEVYKTDLSRFGYNDLRDELNYQIDEQNKLLKKCLQILSAIKECNIQDTDTRLKCARLVKELEEFET